MNPRPKKTLADLLIDYLAQLSVDFVFGIPGGAIEPLYNALALSMRNSGPRPILARHETGAAFMADGYYRQTGKLGVCCATTGPGATNLLTGVASAYENRIPLLVITAQTALSLFGKGAFQESSCTGINTVSLFGHCTRLSSLVSHPNQFEPKLINAVMTAFRSPAGPTHLSIPWDILGGPAPVDQPSYSLPALLNRDRSFDPGTLDQLVQEIVRARKSVLVVGAGCGEAVEPIATLALKLNAALVATPQGKGFVDPYHPLFRGIIGFAGHASARAALTDPDVDTVIGIGSNFSEWASNAWDEGALLNERLIHVDSDADHFARSPNARLHVHGNIAAIVAHVLDRLADARPSASSRVRPGLSAREAMGLELDEAVKSHSPAQPIKPQALMRELANLFPPSTCFLADTGNSQAWSVHYLHPRWEQGHPRGWTDARYHCAFEFASMGWAIGAAVGMALGARGEQPIVCITGDGSLLMSGQELTVAVQERLPVIFVLLNDAALGMVKHGQRRAGSEAVAFELPAIDYATYAQALGAYGQVIHALDDLRALDVPALCRRPGPTLLDVRIDAEEAPPIGMRTRVLGAER